MSRTMKWREIIRDLEQNGFKPKDNNGGSHRVYYNEETGRTAVVSPHKLGEDVKIGTAVSFSKQAVIKYDKK